MIDLLLPILAVALVALAFAGLLLRAGMPGAATVAGLCIGVLLGPDVLGRAAPDTFGQWFRGGVEARAELERLERFERIEAIGRATAGPGQVEIEFGGDANVPTRSDRRDAVARLRAEIAGAESIHRDARRWAVAVLAALLMAAAIQDGVRGWRAIGSRRSEALLLGGWLAVLPAGLGMLLLQSTVDPTDDAPPPDRWATLLLVGAALAIGPWRLGREDDRRAAESETGGGDLLRAGGLAATGTATAAVAVATGIGGPATPMLAIAAAGVLGMLALVTDGWRRRPAEAAPLVAASKPRAGGEMLVTPLIAITLIGIEPFEAFAWWPVLVVAILTADGRYLGAIVAGAMPGTRRGLRAMRLLLPLTAVGPMQASVAALAAASGAIPSSIALALLLAAAIPEVTAPLRGRTDRHLREAESMLEELDETRSEQ